MKKKILSGVLAFAMLFGSAAVLPEGVFDEITSISAGAIYYGGDYRRFKSGEWTYRIYDEFEENDKEISIIDYSGSAKSVTIPSAIDGKKVKSVINGFFENKTIENVIISEGIIEIGDTFCYCSNLKNISIPKSVKKISGYAFENTKWLETQQKKNPLVAVNGILFNARAFNASKAEIPNNIKCISDNCFSMCSSITSVTIPNSVTSIGENAFLGCSNLKNIKIPSSVKSIGDHAFDSTKWLEEQEKNNQLVVVNDFLISGKSFKGSDLTIPENISSIIGSAFSFNTNLKSVKMSDNVNSIGNSAFLGCSNLEKIVLSKNLKVIENQMFFSDNKLSEVTIPDSVEIIRNAAFNSCTNIKSLNIPKNVKKIESGFFANNQATQITADKSNKTYSSINGLLINKTKKELHTVAGAKDNLTITSGIVTIGELAFSGSKVKTVIIPEGVTSIMFDAFYNCNNLKSISLPQSLLSIDSYAFYDCRNLKSITIPKKVSSIGEEALGFVSGSASINHSKINGFNIKCYKDTAGEKYAKDNGFKYTLLRNPEPKATRLAGANRYETASLISRGMYTSTNTVVIATGMDFHDALVAVPLASAYNAPLLLATDKQVTKFTEERLKKLNAKNVIIVSTNGAVGAKVKAALAKYNPTVIGGKTCFETASKVAKALQAKTKKAPDTIFFATDSAFADALSASPVAAIKNAPIIYLKNKGSIDSATAAYLKSVKGKVKNAYIIGGDGVISNTMMKNVATALGLKVGSTVQRVAGKNRYETCVAVNKKFKNVVSSEGICVAKGLDFPDALAGGVYAAKNKQALFLADGKKLQDIQINYLKSKNAGKLTVFGGTGAVSDELVKAIAKASV